ncbi:unnamed protein product [Ambrosiozyma monospora]|uniref:Unnamed protein product n=1 Tax=Ambrosiozyma monospora TaxID=43982 RepID=A0ACB5TX87_AMBMO|nr:unnamed protein product [Ambrosiozyma monospora]
MSSEIPQEEQEQRVTYSSSLLFGKPPLEAMEVLKVRQAQLRAINGELAEWFTAYGRLRLHYVDELKKLLSRGQDLFVNENNPKLHNKKIDSLGLVSPMWNSVLKIAADEAALFDQSTRKMGKDIIAPLKLFNRHNDSNLVEMDDLCTLAD